MYKKDFHDCTIIQYPRLTGLVIKQFFSTSNGSLLFTLSNLKDFSNHGLLDYLGVENLLKNERKPWLFNIWFLRRLLVLFTNLGVLGNIKTTFRSTPTLMTKKTFSCIVYFKFNPKTSFVQKQFLHLFLQYFLKRIVWTSLD